mmetsp:Transcript_80228/g.194454  ORF Transcript_80228/g.194454 Transcript_80228/m.194454 type:complete len:217 (+) Transcript_80228:433-1083(+)
MSATAALGAATVVAPSSSAAGFVCCRRMAWMMYGSRSLRSASMHRSSFSSRPAVIMRSMRGCSGCHEPWLASASQMRCRSAATVWFESMTTSTFGLLPLPTRVTTIRIGVPRTTVPWRRAGSATPLSLASTSSTKRRSSVRHRSMHSRSFGRSSPSSSAAASSAAPPPGAPPPGVSSGPRKRSRSEAAARGVMQERTNSRRRACCCSAPCSGLSEW